MFSEAVVISCFWLTERNAYLHMIYKLGTESEKRGEAGSDAYIEPIIKRIVWPVFPTRERRKYNIDPFYLDDLNAPPGRGKAF